MHERIVIHPTHPQARKIEQVVSVLNDGGLIAYPTDSRYALGCRIDAKAAQDRMRRLRGLDEKHRFTLVFAELQGVATFARIENRDYRLMRALTPGPYTFVLRATRETPRRLQDPRRKTIGIRVPESPLVHDLIARLGEPLMSTTLLTENSDESPNDPHDIQSEFGHALDMVVDGGMGGIESSTVIDLSATAPALLRLGKGAGHPAIADLVD